MTNEQLRYYRGHIVRRIAKALHKEEDDVHHFLKGRFIHLKYLSDDDMRTYINDVSFWAAEHGVELEEPK